MLLLALTLLNKPSVRAERGSYRPLSGRALGPASGCCWLLAPSALLDIYYTEVDFSIVHRTQTPRKPLSFCGGRSSVLVQDIGNTCVRTSETL